jgi:transposase-like protein
MFHYIPKREKEQPKTHYLCTNCGRQCISDYELTYRGCHSWVVNLVKVMLVRGMGRRDISNVLNISITAVLKELKSTIYNINMKRTYYGLS